MNAIVFQMTSQMIQIFATPPRLVALAGAAPYRPTWLSSLPSLLLHANSMLITGVAGKD